MTAFVVRGLDCVVAFTISVATDEIMGVFFFCNVACYPVLHVPLGAVVGILVGFDGTFIRCQGYFPRRLLLIFVTVTAELL